MFRFTDNAITPRRAAFEQLRSRLPAAHEIAQEEAINYLHQHATAAVREAELDPAAVVITPREGSSSPWIGIAHGAAGDSLAAYEFGSPGRAPQAVIRNTLAREKGNAQALYREALRREVGL